MPRMPKIPAPRRWSLKYECSPPAWGGRLAAALAMIFKTLRTCKDDDNLLLRETGDWSYGAVQW